MQQVITRAIEITLEDDGILRARVFEGAHLTLRDMEEHYAFTKRMTGGQKVPVLIDARSEFTITDEARAYAAQEATEVRLATAFIIRSAAMRVFYNLYVQINKPQVPTRMFSSEERAVQWLKTFIDPGYDALSNKGGG